MFWFNIFRIQRCRPTHFNLLTSCPYTPTCETLKHPPLSYGIQPDLRKSCCSCYHLNKIKWSANLFLLRLCLPHTQRHILERHETNTYYGVLAHMFNLIMHFTSTVLYSGGLKWILTPAPYESRLIRWGIISWNGLTLLLTGEFYTHLVSLCSRFLTKLCI